ncbi:hypothetical protein [Lentibacillus sp. CBA3610]|uniref:hypothetical protein n=1 Tax=Lentibacillus sp. CBA3610 TaxID=2518176 RepID=UPI0015959954|nr:hypothetical protein [Lentibacillus sp. CBA3610]QKY69383.1 hypothetical protein Len3610_07045 [Lentibacillus sp. CBA3610]
MRLFSTIPILLLIPSILIGCADIPGQNEGGTLSKKQVLKLDPDADFFEYDNKVYKTGVDWIEDEELTKGEKIGEISEGMANKLPVGASIFVLKERKDILIVEYDGKEKRYLLQAGE